MVLHQPDLGAARVSTPAPASAAAVRRAPAVRRPSAAAVGGTAAVAGIDLGTAHQRDADALLLDLAQDLAGLSAERGAAADVCGSAVLMTHRAVTAAGAHVALSVELDLDAEQAWDVLHAAPQVRGREAGFFLAGRRSGPDDLADGAADAAASAILRSGGRAVRFPGADALTGVLTVAEVLARSAVDRVAVLAGGTARGDQVVRTRGFVRPTCSDGELVLLVQPAAGGTLVPFEVADPTPCCADHA